MDNDIASLVIDQYNRLSSKGKPFRRSNGKLEWTILAGIVVEYNGIKKCVSLATGMKSIADDQLSKSHGTVLHDLHAEVLAIRAFNRWLLTNPHGILQQGDGYFQYAATQGFKLHMYVSEAPCGDASMAVLRENSINCDEQWEDSLTVVSNTIVSDHSSSSSITSSNSSTSQVVRGRDHFHQVGLVRTKPGRRDSPITLSKSCTDKLTLRQYTSVLLGPLATLINPQGFYLSSLVIPESQYNQLDLERAFRLRIGEDQYKHDHYTLQLFDHRTTDIEFVHSKRYLQSQNPNTEIVPCLQSIVYIQGQQPEVILGGVRMGSKPFTGKGQSLICRKSITTKVLELSANKIIIKDTYVTWKSNKQRKHVKNHVYKKLGNWINTQIDDFLIDQA